MKGMLWAVRCGVFAALVCCGNVNAQTPAEYVFSATRYMPNAEWRDFSTLEEAEAFIREEPTPTPIGNKFLRKTSVRDLGHSRVELTYTVPSRKYESYQGGYYDGHATSNYTDCYGMKCRSEEEMVAASMRAYPLNNNYTPVLSGAYLSPPYTMWSSSSANAGRSALVTMNAIHYNGGSIPNERRIVATSASGDSYAYRIDRVDEYRCPELFTASNNTYGEPRYGIWPLVCNNGAHGSITKWLSQRASYSTGCNSNISAEPLKDRVGNPCSADYGNKEYREDDFAWDGFDFRRAYNSIADFPLSSGLGDNWSHSFSDRLTFDGSGYATFWVRSDGYVERLYEVVPGQGTYLSHSSPNLALSKPVKTPSDPVAGVWKLSKPGQNVIWFDASGTLVRKQVASHWVDLAYCSATELGSDECPFPNLVRRATNSRGRVLQFSYTVVPGDQQQPRLARIESEGRVLMEYDHDAKGRIVSAWHDGVAGAGRSYLYGETAYLCRNAAGATISGCDPASFPSHLTGVVDESGTRLATYSYDDHGWVTISEHAGGVGKVTLEYPSMQQTRVTLPSGAVRTFSYEAAEFKRLQGSTTTGGAGTVPQSLSRGYESRWRIAYDAAAGGSRTNYSYAGLNLTARTEGLTEAGAVTPWTRTVQTDWNAAYNEPSEQRTLDSAGAAVKKDKWSYNGRGQPTVATAVDPASGAERITTRSYCEQPDVDAGRCPILGQLIAVDGPRSDVVDVTRFTYYQADAVGCATTPANCDYRKGDLWKITDALGRSTEMLRYDSAGRLLSGKDVNGVVSDNEYSTRGWLLATKIRGADNNSEADDRITRFEYWPTGRIKKSTLPDGASLTYAYDAAQRLTDITDNDGNTIHYTLDNDDKRLKEETKTSTGTLKRTLSRVYNSLGQLQANKDASQNATVFRYDGRGNQDRTTDALGRLADQSYDPLNRLLRTLQDVGGLNVETKFEYDALDRVTKVTDPKGLDTVYAYNGFGDRIRLTSPDTGITNYTYDAAGDVATKQDANDPEPHRYTYDALGRPKTVSYTASGPADVQYDYDTVNGTCTAGETFATGRVTAMRADGTELKYCYDRFGQVVRKVQTVAGKSFNLSYTYTVAGRLNTVTYPDGTVVDYVRDAQARIKEIGVRPSGGARTVLLNNATYEPAGPVSGWTYGNGRVLSRTYDLDYRAKTILDNASGGLSLSYGYNAVGEMTELKDGLQSVVQAKYDYDAIGRLTVTRDGSSNPLETYTYDETGNRKSLLHGGITDTYVYPATSHRLSSVAGVARGYDAAGNTVSIGGAAKEFVYNADGRLSQFKQAGVVKAGYRYNALGERVAAGPSASAVDTFTLYDETGNWIGDYDGAGAAKQQAVWFGDFPVGLTVGNGAGQSLMYVQSDRIGTPRAVVDPGRSTAIWAWNAKVDAFGNSSPNQDPDLDGQQFAMNMRFAGQRFDMRSETNYNYFRDYESLTGRYVQSDPIGLMGGPSTYAYVGSNPISFIDPFGLESPGSFNNGGYKLSWESGPSRIPDYYQGSISSYLGSASLTVSRTGSVYFGYGASNGSIQDLLTGGTRPIAFSAVAGFLTCPELPKSGEPEKIDKFLPGWSGGANGFFYIGGGFSANATGKALEFGIGTPGISAHSEYNRQIWPREK
ncbi:RHS repeat-associated core domain-containing protein [Lysobacter enzymogenes]|uniref:RHS repeat-associated core domain-containing protein n=1 Tax=Lysobacter enzymogenes TaxID=69 RepID=UPI001A95F98E|nr:RHS repeat-associated core domain-containing protein [Lysobacter enzymogenes]QQP94377.1 RHS repeat protein [Lysobacter enzymogenes]